MLVALVLSACAVSGPSTVTVNLGASDVSSVRHAPGQTEAGAGATSASAGMSTQAPAATGTQATATSTVGRDGRSPALVHLQAVLVHSIRSLGPDVGIAVEDLSTGQLLFGQNLGVSRPPASLEKLYTSAALLWQMGPNARLQTDLLGTGHLGPHGIWHGNLYLRGDGDPTFGDGGWNKVYEQGDGPTAGELITQLRAHGITGVDGLLYADASRFDADAGGPATGNAPDVSDYGGELSALVYDHGMTSGKLGPAASAVHEVALSARLGGFHLVAATKPARTPADAQVLAQLESPPMSTMLALMDGPSDDLFADLFAKQLGYRFYGRGTLALGALAIRQAIAAHYGLSPTIFDGSGLDKADRSSPDQLLTLLARMDNTAVGRVLRAALPVVGRSGTVSGIGLKTPAAGRCQAKTGTLNNVTNLAGYCDARGGHTLAFVFLVDGPSNWQSIDAFGRMVGAVAGY